MKEQKDDCCAHQTPNLGKRTLGKYHIEAQREWAISGLTGVEFRKFAEKIAAQLSEMKVKIIEDKKGLPDAWQLRYNNYNADVLLMNSNTFLEVKNRVFSVETPAAIAQKIRTATAAPPLKALILAGGQSLRMGMDKGKMHYYGKKQRIHLAELCQEMGIEAYISCRTEQAEEIAAEGLNPLTDTLLEMGSIGGIVSAMLRYPSVSWLVMACDMPFLNTDVLKYIIEKRQFGKIATAFRNPENDFPEPLLAVWEAKSLPILLQFIAQAAYCPRKVLMNSDAAIINTPPQYSTYFYNANTPDEAEFVRETLKK